MSNQVSNQESHLNTLRFSLPTELQNMVRSMKLLGNDLLVYFDESNTDSVSEKFTEMGFEVVERQYKVHVSGPSSEFATHFSSYESEVRGENVFTVVAKNREQYDELLAMEVDGFRIRPYRQRFANVRSEEDTPAPVQQNSRRERVADTEDGKWNKVSYTKRSDRSYGDRQDQPRTNQRTQQRSERSYGDRQDQPRTNQSYGDRSQHPRSNQRSDQRSDQRSEQRSEQRSNQSHGDRSQRPRSSQRSNQRSNQSAV